MKRLVGIVLGQLALLLAVMVAAVVLAALCLVMEFILHEFIYAHAWTTVLLVCFLSFLSIHSAKSYESRTPGDMKRLIWPILAQMVLLPVAAATILLLAAWWLHKFSIQLLLVGGFVLLICFLLFLSIRGAALASWPIVDYFTRAVLLLLSVAAVVALIPVGVFSRFGPPPPPPPPPPPLYAPPPPPYVPPPPPLEDYLLLVYYIVLIALAAGSVKYVFGWRISYSIVFIAVATFSLVWSEQDLFLRLLF